MSHEHCTTCFNIYCSITANGCPIVSCKAGCYAKYHLCKAADHAEICPLEVVPCINAHNGCNLKIFRYQLGRHLIDCPAYVLLCCFQWVRKMFDNNTPCHTHYCKKPKDIHKQLDLALTFYDQKRGKKKLRNYLGKYGTRACQSVELAKNHFSYSYLYNPAHPVPSTLQWYKTSHNKKQLQMRPPFMTPLPSFLRNSVAYRPPDPLHWTKPFVANKLLTKDKVLILEKDVKECDGSQELCVFGETHVEEEECTRVETAFSCYNVIALNNLPYLHRSEASLHMSCGQLLRRSQISSHTDTVHNRIMSGIMDGWMMERCPLSVYGCSYYELRIQPKGGKHQVMFDDELGVFYLQLKENQTRHLEEQEELPVLPNEIWCLIGQYCDSYTLSQLCCVSWSHHAVASQLLWSRGLAYKRWSRGIGPRCWRMKRKVVTRHPANTHVNISCSFAACKRWESRPKADWGLTTSLTEPIEWELRPDKPHISHHLNICPYNIRVEHHVSLSRVFGDPIIDPSVMLRNFGY